MQTVVSMGATVIGALFGRKVKSVGNVGRAASTARSVGRISREKGDVGRAQEKVFALQEQLDALEAEFQDAIDALELPIDVDAIDLTERVVRPRKGDLSIEPVALVWTPWSEGASGRLEPLFETTP